MFLLTIMHITQLQSDMLLKQQEWDIQVRKSLPFSNQIVFQGERVFAKEFAQEMDKADYPYFCPFPENAKHEDGIDIDIYDISKNSARAKVITEDEAGVKELMQYDNCVFLFMSSKDIYKFEEMLIEAKKSI